MTTIDSILTQQIKSNRTPSLQYIVFTADKILYQYANGFMDVKNEIKSNDKTTYAIYSVTKTFTALAVMQLAQQNMLNIELPVKNYLPGFPYSSGITIKQLLSHTSGIPNPIPLRWTHLGEEHSTFNSDLFFKQIFYKKNKLKFEPGKKFAYSNLGYVLLGQLIEKVSGLQYEDYIRKNILTPLNIAPEEMDFIIQQPEQHAKGYHKKFSFSNLLLGLLINKSKFTSAAEGKWIPFKNNYVNGTAYGGLIGTAGALVKYLQSFLKSNNHLLNEEYKQLMFTETLTSEKKLPACVYPGLKATWQAKNILLMQVVVAVIIAK
ncbi:MAG TPA: serine hydrolase domain-containing protein [Chitinophagaceae bacterium]|nr:serine hydrolase domain-containing protein [Chitinophagaceae bacterium]